MSLLKNEQWIILFPDVEPGLSYSNTDALSRLWINMIRVLATERAVVIRGEAIRAS